MAADDPILTGTVSIANGSDDATFSGVVLSDVLPYDVLVINNVPLFVREVVSSTAITVWTNWTGTSVVAGTYAIYKISPERKNAAGIYSRQRALLDLMERRWFVEQFDDVPANSYGQNGMWALVTAGSSPGWYLRVAGVWVLQGPFAANAPAVQQSATGEIPLEKFRDGVRSDATCLQMALDESHASWLAKGSDEFKYGDPVLITKKDNDWRIEEPVIARDGWNIEGKGGRLVRAFTGPTIDGTLISENWAAGTTILKCYRHHNLLFGDLDNERRGSYLLMKGDRFDIFNYRFDKLSGGWANHMLGEKGVVNGWYPNTYNATLWDEDPEEPAAIFSDGFHGSYLNDCTLMNVMGDTEDDIFAITMDPMAWETMTMPAGRRKSFDGNTVINVRGNSKIAHVLRVGTEPGNGTVDPDAWIGDNIYIGIGAYAPSDPARYGAIVTFDDRRDNATRRNGKQTVIGVPGRVSSNFEDNNSPTADRSGVSHISIYGYGADTSKRNWDAIFGSQINGELMDGSGAALTMAISGVRKLSLASSHIDVGTLTQPARLATTLITGVDEVELIDSELEGHSSVGILAVQKFNSLRTHNLTVRGRPAATGATVTMTIASPCVVTDTAHGLLAGTPIVFTTTGALPTGATSGATYYVSATGLTTNNYQFAATLDGASINTSGSQSGVHTRKVVDEYYGIQLEPNTGAKFEQSGFLTIEDSARGISVTGSGSLTTIDILGKINQNNVTFPTLPTGFDEAIAKGRVRYDIAQSLSSGQKTQVLANIGASALDTGGRLAPLGQPNISDMHTFPGSGFYTTTSNPTNGPGAGYWGGIFFQFAADSAVWEVCQIGIAVPVYYRKECAAGVWGSWEQCKFTLSQALARFARYDSAQTLSGANKTQFLANVGGAPSGWSMARTYLATASGLTTAGVVNPTSLEVIGTDFTVGSDKITANVACRVRIRASQYYWSISGGTVNFGIRKNGSTYLDLDGSSFARRLMCDTGDIALAATDYVQVVTSIPAGTPTWSAVGSGSSIFTIERSY